MRLTYSVDHGFTQWGEEIGTKFRVWPTRMRIEGGKYTMIWRGINLQWRGTLIRIDLITERKA